MLGRIILLIVLLSVPCFADIDLSQIDTSQAEEIVDKVMDFTDGNEIIIIMGDHASMKEKLIFDLAKDRFPRIAECQVLTEEEAKSADLEGKAVFLVGGPNQNTFTSEKLSQKCEVQEEQFSFGVLSLVTAPDGSKYIVASDTHGYNNLARTGPERSPLAKFMPVAYVPVTAAAIGVGLLWLWDLLFNFLKRILRNTTSSKIMEFVKKREWKPEFKGFSLFGVRFKIREWISIALASVVFAAAIAWGYLSGGGLWSFMKAAILVNLIIYAIRHFTRLYMDKRHEIHTEYVFWYYGAIITIFTGWLGNTFSLAGYTLSDKDKTTAKEARIVWIIDLFTFLVGLFFFFWNFFSPSVVAQMAMTLAISIAIIQMLPMKPFAGKKVWGWSKARWWLTFIPLCIVYIIVQLIPPL